MKHLEHQHHLTTLSNISEDLRKKGYTEEFLMTLGGLKSCSNEKVFAPSDIRIVKHYRFEGNSDPGDMSILYAIETNTGLQGTIAEAYGPYSDIVFPDFIRQVIELKNSNNPKGETKNKAV